ncbi:MAG: iron ABC transporter permease, partial [Myxococcales bacterium]|nr:iron ABC transporter permease [Myxococcales bacterium]
LGVSGGAAVGAVAAIVLGLGGTGVVAAAGLPAAAFAGGLAATALVWALTASRRARGASVLLAGVVVNSIATAAITVLEALAEPSRVQSLLFWLIGYLDVPSGAQLAFVCTYAFAGLAVLFADAARMNLLALGDEPATALGLDVRRLERRTLFACAAVVGAIVSVTGLIGFVGLVVPQAMRRLFGPDLRYLLPASALAGSALLVTCDLAVRLASRAAHTEIPVGAVTALLGGPLFLVLLGRSRAGGAAL